MTASFLNRGLEHLLFTVNFSTLTLEPVFIGIIPANLLNVPYFPSHVEFSVNSEIISLTEIMFVPWLPASLFILQQSHRKKPVLS